MEEKYCESCGGTGEGYIAALYGDGWTGRDCDFCCGFGSYFIKDGDYYVVIWPNRSAIKPVLRGPDGRFYALPDQGE